MVGKNAPGKNIASERLANPCKEFILEITPSVLIAHDLAMFVVGCRKEISLDAIGEVWRLMQRQAAELPILEDIFLKLWG